MEYENEIGQFERIKALISIDKGDHMVEEIIAYNKLLDYIEESQIVEDPLNKQNQAIAITSHQGPFKIGQIGYKGSTFNITVQWDDRDITSEKLATIAQEYPMLCATYAKKHKLLNQPGWKHLRRYLKTNKKITRMIKKAVLRQGRRPPKFKFGFQVPRDYKEAMTFDSVNGNTKWKDAINQENEQLDEYNTFKDLGTAQWDRGKVSNAPSNYTKISVH